MGAINQFNTCRDLVNLPNNRSFRNLLVCVVVGIISATLDVASLALLVPFVGVAIGNGVEDPSNNITMLSGVFANYSVSYMGSLIVVAVALGGACRLLLVYVTSKAVCEYRFAMEKQIFNLFLVGRVDFDSQLDLSSLPHLVFTEVGALGNAFKGIVKFTTSFTVTIILTVSLVILAPDAVVLIFLVLAGFYYFISKLLKPLLHRASENRLLAQKRRHSFISELADSYQDIFYSRLQARFSSEFTRTSLVVKNEGIFTTTATPAPRLALDILVAAFIVFGVVIASGTSNPSQYFGIFSAIVYALMRLAPNIQGMFSAWANVLLAEPSLIRYRSQKAMFKENWPMRLDAIARRGKLKGLFVPGIHFKHPQTSELVFQSPSFRYGSSGMIGLMGESGSGKSTYLRALSGVFGPAHQGWLEFESKSVGRYAPVPYSPAIYISQHSVLHSGSVKQNLVSGLGREVDDKVLRRTLRDVGMTPTDDFLDYEIDAQNSNISGGERQRLLLARTILHSVPVIIIDEVTSGLDLDTERKIWTLLKDMSKSKIIFIATHSTLALSYCDRIIRLPFESDLPYDKQMGTKNIV